MPELEQTIIEQARVREAFFADRDERMDLWLSMYMLIDRAQDDKPPGQTRYIDPMPKSLVKRSQQILTRNPIHPHVVFDRELEPERETIRKVERFVTGLFADINESLRDRLEPPAEQSAAWFALVRGWICSELWLTKESGRDDSPVWFNFWDPRYTYPRRDRAGLHSVLHHVKVPASEVLLEYEDAPIDEIDYETLVDKYIWWDRTHYSVVADYLPKKGYRSKDRKSMTLRQVKHGLSRIPVDIVAVNGDPINAIPPELHRWRTTVRDTGADMPARDTRKKGGPLAFTAAQGQSIFSAIEEAWPQFNHYMSMVEHAVSLAAYPTVNVYTRNGSAKEFEYGTGIVNYFSVQANERAEAMPLPGMPQGADLVLANLSGALSKATIPPSLLDQDTGATSGFHLAQAINIGLNALGAFSDGLDDWQARVAQNGLRQAQNFPGDITFRGAVPDQRNTFFEVTFERGEITRMYDIVIERSPAVPDDMMLRTQLAGYLTNPSRPLMSLQTVLDTILKVDDVEGELDKMFEDMAMLHPAVVSKRLEKVLIERGQMDLLPYVQNEAVIQALMQEIQKKQAEQTFGMMSAPQNGTAPNIMPPEMGSPATETGMQPLAAPTGGGGY